MKIKAVLFDMDGTIIHSRSIWDDIVGSIVGKENVKLFRESRAKLPERGMQATGQILRSVFNVTKTDTEILELLTNKSKEFFNKSEINFIDGFREFHRHLIDNGVYPSLATNAPNYAFGVIKEKLKLQDLFGAHIYNSCSIGGIFKPDPKIFLHAVEKLQIDVTEAIVFEDSLDGITAARRARIKCVGVESHNNFEEIKSSDFIVKNYKDLNLEILNKVLN